LKFKRVKLAKFQEQNCALTLREAVDEFYSINSHLFSRPDPHTSWTHLLVYHDVAHVFFGVNTSLMDEAAGDCWHLFGTDMTVKDYIEYGKTPEGKKLFKQIGAKLIFKSIIYGLPIFFDIFFRSKKMSKKWKLRECDKFMDTPLGELRNKFNLKILSY